MKRFIFPGALGLALYLAIFGGEYSVLEARRAKAELEARRAEVPALRNHLDSLRAWIDSLQHNDGSLERFARERYGFIRDGEYLYRISDPAAKDGQADSGRR